VEVHARLLLKTASRDALFDAVRAVCDGQLHLSSEAQGLITFAETLSPWVAAPPPSLSPDPRVACPELVGQAAAHLRTSALAAALYLVYLAWIHPTDTDLKRRLRLSPKALRSAQDELVDGGWLVRAKRARAGRTVFLPGAWVAYRSPTPPAEAWKLAQQGYAPDRLASPWPFGAYLQLRPYALAFEAAWQDVVAGSGPGRVEVTPA